MKKAIPTIAALATILLLQSCSSNDVEPNTGTLPITIGNIAVAGYTETGPTRTDGLAPFYAGDKLELISTYPGYHIWGHYTYTPHGTWAPPTPVPLVSNLEGSRDFSLRKAANATLYDQSTWEKYHNADELAGYVDLHPLTGLITNTSENPLRHTKADVVIVLTNNGGWTLEDWEHHIRTARIVINATNTGESKPVEYTPWLSSVTTNTATLRAFIPSAWVPQPGENIITITPAGSNPITGSYTMKPGSNPIVPNVFNQRLTITFDYAPRHIQGTAQIEPWESVGPPETITNYSGYDMVIRTEEDLKLFRDMVNGSNGQTRKSNLTAIQMGHIVLTDANWTPIGTRNTVFQGAYNGNGYTITGLTITGTDTDNKGLFGYASGATLTGIHLRDVNVSGYYNVGALAGFASNNSIISHCSVTNGTVTGSSVIGGLVGINDAGSIYFCYATVDVTSNNNIGGLVGRNTGTIASCYATGTVKGASARGALVGWNNDSGTVTYSHAVPKGDATGLIGSDDGTAENNSETPGAAGETVRGYPGGVTINGITYTAATVWSLGAEPIIKDNINN